MVPDLLTLFPEYRRPQYKAKIDEQTQEYLKELREAYLHEGLVLYVGAGVSRSAGLPSWSELIQSLTLAMMTRKVHSAFEALGKIEDERYWEALSEIQADVERGADYVKPILMMARAIKTELKDDLPLAILRTFRRHAQRQALQKSREFTLRSSAPTSPLVEALISLARAERDTKGVQAIVNYNYDDILDEGLRKQNVRCVTVRSGKERIPQGSLPCYHVHGVLPLSGFWTRRTAHTKPANYGNFVFSEDEYHAEYSDPYKWSNMTQISLLGRHTGLFVGLSLEDPNIRRLIDVTFRQYPENVNYAILPRKKPLAASRDNKACVLRNLFEQVETSSFGRIGVRVIWVDSHKEVSQVVHRICDRSGAPL